MTDHLRVLLPPGWPRPRGYANGIIGSGTIILTGGMIGWDAEGRFAEGLAGQVEQALRNVVAVLAEATAGPADVARMTWYLTDMAGYREQARQIGAAWRAVMGRHFPAMAVVGVTTLVEPLALVEIEATAILPIG